jgi:translation initiation factor 1 (eIF-1/SUI1)
MKQRAKAEVTPIPTIVITHIVIKIIAQQLKRKVAIENCTVQDGTDPSFGIPYDIHH